MDCMGSSPRALTALPSPGDGCVRDFTGTAGLATSHQSLPRARGTAAEPLLRVLSWNIERGAALQGVIAALIAADADVIALQEVDVQTGRGATHDPTRHSERITLDCAQEIAERAHYPHCLVACEMKLTLGGIMCNAILSRYPLSEARALCHATQPMRYTEETTAPGAGNGVWQRTGLRTCAVAVVHSPIGDVQIFSDHFEMRCGISGRLAQLEDLLRDAEAERGATPMQIIAGDLNTFVGGALKLVPARLPGSPHRFNDPLVAALGRIGGVSEALLWQHAVLGCAEAEVVGEGGAAVAADAVRLAQRAAMESRAAAAGAADDWSPRARGGARFGDPFDAATEWTFAAKLGPLALYRQKLDWLLCSERLRVVDRGRGNTDFAASDHAFIWVDVVSTPPLDAEEEQGEE